MFQIGDKIRIILGDYKDAIGIVVSITKGRDLPNGTEVQEPFYIVELEGKKLITISEDYLDTNHD
ncbi:hypothetical protein ACFLW8_01750 [Chloroflexota bacterium]